MRCSGLPSVLWVLFFFAVQVKTALVNRTIDDTLGDSVTRAPVSFLPGSVWFNQTTCSGCADVPNSSLTFDKTWTAALYLASIGSISATMKFSGTAIYVYFVVPNFAANSGLANEVLCDFLIDGSKVGGFQHKSDGSGAFNYDTLVYANTSIPNGDHTLIIQTTGTTPAVLIFDRAIYTFGDVQQSVVRVAPPTTTSSTSQPPTDPVSNVQTTSSTTSATPSSSSPVFPIAPDASLAYQTPTSLPPFYITAGGPTPSIPAIPGSNDSSQNGIPPNTSRIIAIAGSAAGAMILCIFIGVGIMLCSRRRKQRQHKPPRPPRPEMTSARSPAWIPPHELVQAANTRSPMTPASGSVASFPNSSVPAAGPSGYGRTIAATQTKPPSTPTGETITTAASVGHGPHSPSALSSSYGHSYSHSAVSESTSDSQASDSLRIHIPRSAFALAANGSSTSGPSPLTSQAHSPIIRTNGAPLPAEQEANIRVLLASALASNAQTGGSLSVSIAGSTTSESRSGAYTPTSETGSLMMATPTTANPYRYTYRRPPPQPYDGIELNDEYYTMLDHARQHEQVGVVHVDSGIRISRTLLDLPPGYSAS
ncbi:hypothetical protein MIND_00026400 [Mycena indigotica]|uniref:Uncharacterized protein n=1 Tax=Mycena indigotica TaxID=2126181 RepID=A0A8H6WFU3_9AGAR|nr:uncharacterized protein MIND_00026400 [Mycena indigotica]KAF7315121.1 hypothetical protein MIND_00026400 [Mycena indigotica]